MFSVSVPSDLFAMGIPAWFKDFGFTALGWPSLALLLLILITF